jgi:hypothetical protein
MQFAIALELIAHILGIISVLKKEEGRRKKEEGWCAR